MDKINITIPNGMSLEVDLIQELDSDLAKIIFSSVLGAIFAISKIKNKEDQRNFFMRYTSVLVSEAEAVLHSCQMSNSVGDKPTEQIIEDLLKSIKHKPK